MTDLRTSTYQEGDKKFQVEVVKDKIKETLKDTQISQAFWFFDVNKAIQVLNGLENKAMQRVIPFGTILSSFDFRISEAMRKTEIHYTKFENGDEHAYLISQEEQGLLPAEAEALLGAFKELLVKKFMTFIKTKKVN